MSLEGILQYAKDKQCSQEEATQVFMQVITLKNLSLPGVHFMGGTALVFGYGNPRFSEDIDLTQVRDPHHLAPGLSKSAREISQWLGSKVNLQKPKAGKRTWKIVYRISPSQSVRLHIDTQPFLARTSRPIVIEFPSLASFVCEALTLEEILSEKVLALTFRNYLSGRDIFDLWFHWLRKAEWEKEAAYIFHLVRLKLKERKLSQQKFQAALKKRLNFRLGLARTHQEWQRYLPSTFQTEKIFKDMQSSLQKLSIWIK